MEQVNQSLRMQQTMGNNKIAEQSLRLKEIKKKGDNARLSFIALRKAFFKPIKFHTASKSNLLLSVKLHKEEVEIPKLGAEYLLK